MKNVADPKRLRWLVFVLLPALLGCQQLSTLMETSHQPDPKNELPFGMIDNPPDHAVVSRQVQMYGWALDDERVTEVRFFVDGHFIKTAPLNQGRDDVVKAYPSYTNGKGDLHGWAVTVPLPTGSSHAIVAQAVDSKGATRDIGAITVTVGQ